MRAEIREGFAWLWQHDLLRTLAIALGMLNGLGMLALAVEVLFAQEVLGLSAAGFGALMVAGGVGGVVGSLVGARASRSIGPGASLFSTVLVSALAYALIGLVPSVLLVGAAFAITAFVGMMWNVVTVALRQSLIFDQLLGRVNSVYRFFGWGMMPVGSIVGGARVVAADAVTSREMALRASFLVAAALHLAVFAYVAPRLGTDRIEAAKRVGIPAKRRADEAARAEGAPG